ncbi:HDOD domain-containing protein [Chitinibacter tainanensis]|uniref:HDOD domain-containing protein n=1 Tax=Chitinibacter tainanensis TaxID=230667 RepID=UPI000428047B|nr:HDOD domain-containing protein [Chitinibacter tainanensis]
MGHPHELSPEDIEQVLASVDIPSCSAVVQEAMLEAQRDDPDLRKLARLIAADAGLLAKVLKMANSPLFSASKPTSNVLSALERLGTRNIHCIVMTAALKATMQLGNPYTEAFWTRTVLLAQAAGLLARQHSGVALDAAYLYALFHDVGQPLMAQRYSEYPQVLINCREVKQLQIDAETDYFPCTHPVVGALLIRNWGLPALIGKAIRYHHEPELYKLPESTLPAGALTLIAIVQITERLLLDYYAEADQEVGDGHFAAALAHLGMTETDLDAFQEELQQKLLSA